jgi:hypothetical protein
MSGSTPELSLATAVDADDNADYLTINLANSLRTVDALFNNVTGHSHNGAHQGGPVAPAAGSITSGMIADGTIVAADIANATITNAKLATDTARANLLTNGGFEVWQRGGGPFTGNGTRTADAPWTITLVGSDTMSVSQDGANIDSQSRLCAVATFTLGTGGGLSQLVQTIKWTEFAGLSGATVSASGRVRTSTANAVRLGVYNGSAWTYSSFHTGSGTYQTLTVPNVALLAGQTYYVAFFFAASCTAYIDNAMLVVGSVPADYAPLHPADDLARCLRYYERVSGDVTNGAITSGQCVSTTFAIAPLRYAVKKAVTPTVTLIPASNYALTQANGTQAVCTAVSSSGVGATGCELDLTATGLVAGNATTFFSSSGAQAYISVEGNP